MQHIAEERLHAYVDRDRSDMTAAEAAAVESHIAECGVCRAVVEEGALLRQRANTILARSGPQHVVRPDFAAIQARAGVTAEPVATDTVIDIHEPRRMRRSYVGLAWAASLIAALGLGFLTRDLFTERDQVAVEMASEAESEEAATFSAPSATPGGVGDASGIGALPPTAEASPVAPTLGDASRSAEAAAKIEEAPQSAAGAGAAAGAARAAAPVRAQDFSGAGAAGVPQASARALDSAVELQEIVVTGSSGGITRDAQDAAPPPPPTAAPARERVAQTAPSPAPEQAAASRAAAAPPAAPAPPRQAASARLAWVELDRAAAEQRFGARLLTIPELRVTRIAVLGSGAGAMARTWYSGPGRVEIALSQTRQSSGLLQVTPTEPSRQVGEMVLMLEGDLPVQSLRDLLSRAR